MNEQEIRIAIARAIGRVAERPDVVMSPEWGDDSHDGVHMFQLLHATAIERCLAFLEMFGGQSNAPTN